jgi:glycosyltransferase involved in cell wall biosynthesis
MKRVLFDVSQYFSWPARSGVQRVLLHLASKWRGDRAEASFGYLDSANYITGPLEALGSVMSDTFQEDEGTSDARTVRDALAAASSDVCQPRGLAKLFDAYFLPEPTLNRPSLHVASDVLRERKPRPFFLYFDALPLTNPECYPAGADQNGGVTAYHQLVSRADNVAFISAATRRTFETRLARRQLSHGLVALPGSDGLPTLPHAPEDQPTFVVLGTVEPRKRHQLILEAFERLWSEGREYRLIVLGAAGWEDPALIERLRRLGSTRRVEWIEHPTDRKIASGISRGWAVVFTPYAEGFGLPPLEALAQGCPVIVSADLPSLEDLPSDGQVRLDEVTPESLAAAVSEAADPEVNARLRAATHQLDLPTWTSFVGSVEAWISRGLT